FAVASHLPVDLSGKRLGLRWISDSERQLPAGPVHAARYSRGVADGEALFLLRQKACGDRSLQSAAETRLHDHHRAGRAVGADWDRNLETGAIFVASLADGRIPLGAPVALPG